MSIWVSNGLFVTGRSLYPVSSKTTAGTKWGYINARGKIQIKQIYDYANDFQSNGLAVVQKGNKSGVINQDGRYIIKPKYESISEFKEGRAQVIDDEGFKVVNQIGRMITQKAYSFIGSYENGRALFGETNEQGQYLYGYLDRQGKEVIPAQFKMANEFHKNQAVVQLGGNKFALIDKNGQILYEYLYPYVGNLGDGLLPFKEKEDGKYGYINIEGDIVIPPAYSVAMPFEQGYAIVNQAEDYSSQYGLINKEGTFIIAPVYNDIHFVGKNRVAVGIAIKEDAPYYDSKYALATTEGHFLTNFDYFTILEFREGAASVTTGTKTFFIDKNGQQIKALPVVNGEGTVSIDGDLVKANVDYRVSYYDRSGNMVWKQNKVIPLQPPYRVIEKKYKPTKDYLVYYPEIAGMSNRNIQHDVNEELKKLAKVKPIEPQSQLDYSYFGDFSITFYAGKLLVIEIEGYEYPFGAAHGMPTRVYVHLNLETGTFYKLEDLFKNNSDFIGELSAIIGNAIKTDEQYSYVFPDTYKGIREDQPFYLNEEFLFLYFEPYEIAPYAAGFPTFKIPFTEIMNIIDAEGEFWKSFHGK